MNANNNAEDPQYEYLGKENYTPTSAFLRKVFLILDFQLITVLIAHISLGP